MQKNINEYIDSLISSRSPETIVREKKSDYFGVFDIETQRSAADVGGWNHADRMGISCVVLYDSKTDSLLEFLEEDIALFIDHLKELDLVIGFNIKRFDYQVLSGYSDFNFSMLPTLDLLEVIHRQVGYRLSLNHLAAANLGTQKSADGLQALRWWKQGKIAKIVEYCKKDVEITKDIFMLGRKNGFLLFNNRAGKSVRIPINW